MLKKRVIFSLLYDNGSFMLSRNFRLQKIGNLKWLQKNYNFSHISFSIDELLILDVTRGERDIEKFSQHVQSLTEECFVPIAAGGGIRTLECARKLLHSGADKVVLNTIVATNPELITEIAKEFGRQSIIVSVDVKVENNTLSVWTENGSVEQKEELTAWLAKINDLPVGELYVNSIDRDGTGQGYKQELLINLPEKMRIPVIIAGGAGKFEHLSEGLNEQSIDAVATAHLLNFVGDGLEKSRQLLLEKGFDLAKWDINKAKNLKDIITEK